MSKNDEQLIRMAANAVAIGEVQSERQRQVKLWGHQSHEPYGWLAILMEEIGEAANAALHTSEWGKSEEKTRQDFMKEMVQVAAVALACLEDLGVKSVEGSGS
jgi:hypothetical protein